MSGNRSNRLVVLQFAAIAVPLVLLLVTQSALDAKRALVLRRVVPEREAIGDIRGEYRTFENGVVDAIDTGALGGEPGKALQRAAGAAGHVSALDGRADVQATMRSLQALAGQVPEHAPLATLLPLRGQIQDMEHATHDLDEQVAAETAALVSGTSRMAIIQAVLALVAVAGTLWLALRFVRGTQRELAARAQADAEAAASGTRLRHALDHAATPVLIGDQAGRVIYFNEAAHRLLAGWQEALRREVPGFDADSLLGQPICLFGEAAAGAVIRKSLADANVGAAGAKVHDVAVGGLALRLVCSPVLVADGGRIGTVLELEDRTVAVATEREVRAIVEGASRGELAGRIDLAGKDETFRPLAIGINTLLERNQAAVVDAVRMFQALADGDLGVRVTADYQGELEQLRTAANGTAERLVNTVRAVQGAITALEASADALARDGGELSRRTESQAASLEQAAATLEELSSTVRHTADNAQQGDRISQAARVEAERGGQVVKEAVEAMAGIHAASEEIAKITEVVDDLAFQTNLLALNAAVEAARAGEQGRGFAVVATEVRSLAGRSAEAARRIKALVSDSAAKVGVGRSLVERTATTLGAIVESTKKVTAVNGEISAASHEQSSGIEQATKAVGLIDESVQKNAQLVGDTGATARSIREQADNLAVLMGFFKLGKEQPARRPGGRAAA